MNAQKESQELDHELAATDKLSPIAGERFRKQLLMRNFGNGALTTSTVKVVITGIVRVFDTQRAVGIHRKRDAISRFRTINDAAAG